MTTLRDILAKRSFSVVDIGPDATVLEALEKMYTNNVGSLVVLEGRNLVGIFTERHFARNVFMRGNKSPDTKIGDVMHREVIVGRPESTVEECLALMTSRGFRHLPVIAGDEVVGMVTMTDLVKTIVGEQQFTIDQLNQYMLG